MTVPQMTVEADRTPPFSLAAGMGAAWLGLRDVERALETDCGTRAARREGPSHIVSPFGISDVSHAAPPKLVAAMIDAAHAATIDMLLDAFPGSTVVGADGYDERARAFKYAGSRGAQHDVDEALETLW